MQRGRLVIVVIAALVAIADARLAPAQETVIYNFVSTSSGYNPHGPLAIDNQGNLYGIMTGGIFEVTPPSEAGGQWTEQQLYDSLSGPGLHSPSYGLVFDAKGNLYGIASDDTEMDGQSILGFVAEVSPPSTAGGTWTSQIIHTFLESNKTANCGDPQSYLAIDSKGNLYGTCTNGGANGVGGVYELSPPTEAGGQWTEQLIHSFAQDGVDGNSPGQNAGLILDAQGNLYGTTQNGGMSDGGVVYELSPGTGSAWTETILYTFVLSGPSSPYGAVVFDHQGNLYTTTYDGGTGGGGAVVELSPPAKQGSEWALTQLYAFSGKTTDGRNPAWGVLFDAAGNLWGTTFHGGPYYQINEANSDGALFELVPQAGGGWQEVVRHFFGAPGDVFAVTWPMVIDSKGNLYAAGSGGANNCGNINCGGIFEYTPSASTLAPSIAANGVENGASFQPGIVPGSWATITGSNLSSVTDTWDNFIVNGQLPAMVDNVSLTVGGQPAYVYYVSPAQINFIVPDVRTGTQQVTVTNSAGTSQRVSVTVDNFAPAFFSWPNNQVVATDQNFTYAAASGTFSGVRPRSRPSRATRSFFGARDSEPTSPAPSAGEETPSNTTYNTATMTVTINNFRRRCTGRRWRRASRACIRWRSRYRIARRGQLAGGGDDRWGVVAAKLVLAVQ